MNLLRWVKQLGYEPRLAGNIKGLQDRYRNPTTQKGFAEQHHQGVKMITSFADGTKISMEMAVVANATGFKVDTLGMHGPRCEHVTEAPDMFSPDQLESGSVDYLLGAEPGPGVFVIGHNENPILQQYASYLKMGSGPYYTFYIPYHLPHLESPLTVARACLFGDAATSPMYDQPIAQVRTVAKRDLEKEAVLDGIGGYDSYGVLDNIESFNKGHYLPMGLSEGCVLKRNILKDQPILWEDVEIKGHEVARGLYAEQKGVYIPQQLL